IRSVVLAFHKISIHSKYYRPRSHRVEVAASGDPRANGDSTLKFANQTKSITVRLLIAPENTTPVPADTRAEVLSTIPTYADISKSMKRRRSRRAREEKKTETCAHVKTIEIKRKERNDNRKILDKFSNMQPFARKYLQATRYRYITSTADPGPTAWRLLLLETRGLTQSNGVTSTPDEFKPPNAKIAAPCVSAFGNRLTHSSTIQHRKLRSPLEHDRSCFRDKRRNPELNPTALTDTYASIPETLTRVC
ncbi:hypothetical protein V1477_019979, partial [Vespula maculifrons]